MLLLGDGAGGFNPVWPNRSGLVIPDDAKGLASLDLNADGADDFVVGINSGRFRTFQAAAANGRRLRLRLRGPQGNPTAVGAKVSVTTFRRWPNGPPYRRGVCGRIVFEPIISADFVARGRRLQPRKCSSNGQMGRSSGRRSQRTQRVWSS